MKSFLALGLSVILAVTSSLAVGKQIEDAQWYLHADVSMLQASNLVNGSISEGDREVAHQVIDEVFNPTLKAQTVSATFYGDELGVDNAVMLIQGDYSDDASNAFIGGLADRPGYEKLSSENGEIYAWYFDEHLAAVLKSIESENSVSLFDADDVDENGSEKIYLAQLNNKAYVAAKQPEQIEKWLDGSYQLSSLNNGNVFEVVVNVQDALVHGGLNTNGSVPQIQFDSEIMQKVEQASFKLEEVGNLALMELALTTTDSETAMQIQSIVTGLVALQQLSGKEMDAKAQALLNNLQIELVGDALLIKTEIDVDLLNQERN